MASGTSIFEPAYRSSWALVVGINTYQKAPPLGYARQDAEAIASLLVSKLEFPEDNVELLFDAGASRDSIMSAYFRLSGDHVHPDDRIVFFFAGHGVTRVGRRGEIGYLVPNDGDIKDLATLIRWDDLTRNAELIPAKHMLFLMDACYGGLAVGRALPPGSSRFLKDMLQRYSRQVLSAGKADQVVADAGGPRPGHSIFTGHLLEALEGAAATPDGIISANGVMAHVYDRVARDPHSAQSPHYGFIDGDGDLVFAAPNLSELGRESKEDEDILVHLPASLEVPDVSSEQSFVDRVKDYLSDRRFRIRLDDLVAAEVRAALQKTRAEAFPTQAARATPEEFARRLRAYEEATARLSELTILLSRWGTTEHQGALERIVSRLADTNQDSGGNLAWLGLRWYPLTLLMYAGGVAALSARNYESLATLLTSRLGSRATGRETTEAVVVIVDGMLEVVRRTDMFKTLPGHERNYVPKSEYLFKAVQARVEDLLFLGNSYEDLFDRFEVFQALTYADLVHRDSQHFWGPPGRFGYKHRGSLSRSPLNSLLSEAEQHGSAWPPLQHGLFAGSIERFKEIAEAYKEQVLNQLAWY